MSGGTGVSDVPRVPAGLTGGGPALFRLVRFWSRRWTADAARHGTGDAAHVGHVLVLEAIDAASSAPPASSRPPADGGPPASSGQAADGGPPASSGVACARDSAASRNPAGDRSPASYGPRAAIGDVAVQLGLDRSNASRMLASAVAAGLVTKTTHPADARRTELTITPVGRDLLAAARAWQDRVFARLVADWPEADARRLAGYLQRLADSSLAGGSLAGGSLAGDSALGGSLADQSATSDQSDQSAYSPGGHP